MTLHLVDLAQPLGPLPFGVLVATGDPDAATAEFWLERATFTLVERASEDRRTVQVPSVAIALAEIRERVERWPRASAVCDDVLRALDVTAPAFAGVITESLAYSTLQSGPEFVTVARRAGSGDRARHPRTR